MLRFKCYGLHMCNRLRNSLLALVVFLLAVDLACWGQEGVRVLFVGNSYTEVNNLPQMVQQVAQSMGETVVCQSSTPGGCTFAQHCANQSMGLIRQGGWDYVVLQEQSQLPSFPQGQVEAEVFPYAQRLVDSVYRHSPCAEPVFYMTWGHKDGDARNAPYFPVLGTYEGMDSMLCLRYTYMARAYDASLCPVGRVWRRLREQHPEVELYQSDGSHPTVAGSYAAACAFYTLFFHRDPDSIVYSAGLDAAVARTVRGAVHDVVFSDLGVWQRQRPEARLAVQVSEEDSSAFVFVSSSLHADSLRWDFGDGFEHISAAADSVVYHIYSTPGTYEVALVALRHCMADTLALTVEVPADSAGPSPVGVVPAEGVATPRVYPNPVSGRLTIDGLDVVSVEVYDPSGRSVARFGGTNHPDLGSLAAGVYLLRIRFASGSVVRQVEICR